MDPVTLRLALVVALVLVVAAAGRGAAARRDRLVVVTPDVAGAAGAATGGASAVLFGSATCAPCDRVKALLRDAERERADFTWTYVDAADHLDLAREHGVRRVPTLLVMDDSGRVAARSSGVPRPHELADAIATAAGEDRDDRAHAERSSRSA